MGVWMSVGGWVGLRSDIFRPKVSAHLETNCTLGAVNPNGWNLAGFNQRKERERAMIAVGLDLVVTANDRRTGKGDKILTHSTQSFLFAVIAVLSHISCKQIFYQDRRALEGSFYLWAH